MAARSDITESDHFFLGEDRDLRILVVDETGAPLDCSSFTLVWNLSRNEDDDPVVVVDSGITFENGDGTGDLVVVPVEAADTADLLPGWYKHSLWRTGTGNTWVITFGKCYLGRAAG